MNNVIRNITECDLVFTVPYPLKEGTVERLYSFVDYNCKIDKNLIILGIKERLPNYMIPKNIYFVKDFPLNSNGKVDISKLIKNNLST